VHGAVIDEILVQTQGSTDAFYHHDALGSTVLLTNASGNIVRSYEYDAFGKVSNPPSVDDMFSADPYANRFLYTGREFLKEANLYDYRNRVYSAELGRFLQSDPIRFDAGDVNLYRYVYNSSVIKTDPLGLEEKCCKSGNWSGDVIYSVVAGVIGPGVFNGSVTCTDDSNMKASIAGIMLGWGGGYSTGSTNLKFSGAKKPSDLVGKQDVKIMVGVLIFGIGGDGMTYGVFAVGFQIKRAN
jgi:RHS repeat-associated protein